MALPSAFIPCLDSISTAQVQTDALKGIHSDALDSLVTEGGLSWELLAEQSWLTHAHYHLMKLEVSIFLDSAFSLMVSEHFEEKSLTISYDFDQ